MHPGKVNILNISISNYSFIELLQTLKEGVVFTPNVDHLMKLQRDRSFYEVYQKADYIVCDSRIIQATSGLVSRGGIKEQIAGSEFFPAFCRYHCNHSKDIRVFLLGGTTKSVSQAQRNLNHKCKNQVVIGGYSPPFGFENDPKECDQIIQRINESGATVLAVGVGAPKQEKWIIEHKHKMPNVKIFFAIGATIDFQAGSRHRPPKWVSRIGLEWAYRLCQEPQRLSRRYFIDDIPYFALILKQKLGWYQNPWASQ